MKAFLLASSILISLGTSASALTAEQLVNLCAAIGGKEEVEVPKCIYWINGFTAAVFALQTVDNLKTCLPSPLSDSQSREAILNYVGKHPKMANLDASVVALAGLKAAFPCRNSN